MIKLARLWSVVLIIFGLNAVAKANGKYFYRVQPNDTASDILYRAAIKPLYPRHQKSTLQILIEENQGLLQDISKIYPGQKIYFSEKTIQKALKQNLVEIINNEEIIFTGQNTVQNTDEAEEKSKVIVSSNNTDSVAKSLMVSAPDTEPENNEHILMYNQFYISSGFNKIEAVYKPNASKAELFSDQVFNLGYEHYFLLEERKLFLGFNYSYIPIRNSITQSVSSRFNNLSSIFAGFEKKLQDKNSLTFKLSLEEVLLASTVQAGFVQFETRPLVSLTGYYKKSYLNHKNLTFLYGFGASYKADQSLSVGHNQHGYSLIAGSYIYHRLHDRYLLKYDISY